ncbi:hypothetical protein DPEC_G00254020 [Dallia pectoralis]|uniref:Uncharacterized protein n=1 Tax=Dallia pectoralis TaxID=75939 RepID=A0ACC2FUA4_DALPE|nr:hypothetical protein DPEC_G00254020 [Dallia pectoralis]
MNLITSEWTSAEDSRVVLNGRLPRSSRLTRNINRLSRYCPHGTAPKSDQFLTATSTPTTTPPMSNYLLCCLPVFSRSSVDGVGPDRVIELGLGPSGAALLRPDLLCASGYETPFSP